MDLILKPATNTVHKRYPRVYELVESYNAVPKFFQYDGASIPRIMWPIIGGPFNPRFMKAAVQHDWNYYVQLISRKEADINFKNDLLDNGVSKIKAATMFRAVRMFGGTYWGNDKEDLEYLALLSKQLIENDMFPQDYGIML